MRIFVKICMKELKEGTLITDCFAAQKQEGNRQ